MFSETILIGAVKLTFKAKVLVAVTVCVENRLACKFLLQPTQSNMPRGKPDNIDQHRRLIAKLDTKTTKRNTYKYS